MRTAIYIEDGVTQLVLTPDNEWERKALNAVANPPNEVKLVIHSGVFYDCRGGWVRQKKTDGFCFTERAPEETSIILRVEPKTE